MACRGRLGRFGPKPGALVAAWALHWLGTDFDAAAAQLRQIRCNFVKFWLQGAQGLGLRHLGQRQQLAFEPVQPLAQLQGPCQPGTALEGVQKAQQLAARCVVLRTGRPLAQRRMQLRQQQLGLVLENREQIGVERESGRGFDQRSQGACRPAFGLTQGLRPGRQRHAGQPGQDFGGRVAQNTGCELVQDALHLLHRLSQERMRREHWVGG